jgi:hypothetical protein
MTKREEIQTFVGQFVEGLVKLMREQAHETVDATFGEDAKAEAPAQEAPVRQVSSAASRERAEAAPGSTRGAPKAGARGHPLEAELGRARDRQPSREDARPTPTAPE